MLKINKINSFIGQRKHEIQQSLNPKHSGNLGHNEKNKPKIIGIEEGELRLKAWKIYSTKNHREKISQTKEGYPYVGPRKLQNTK